MRPLSRTGPKFAPLPVIAVNPAQHVNGWQWTLDFDEGFLHFLEDLKANEDLRYRVAAVSTDGGATVTGTSREVRRAHPLNLPVADFGS